MTQGNESPVETPATPVVVADQKKDFVSYDTHRKLLDEKKKLEAFVADVQKREQEKVEAEARKRGEYEVILKSREEELAKERAKTQQYEQMIVGAKKHNAVIEALGGNIDPRLLDLIDVSDVAVNPDTGEVDTMTVAQVADSLKKKWPEFIKAKTNLPANAPQGLVGGAGKISRAEWLKLPPKEMLKWKPDQIQE